MSTGVSQLYTEEGQMWLRVSPGHAISEQWLQEQAPDLYAEWWAAPSVAARDQLALRIEQRLEELELADSWDTLTEAYRQRPGSALAQKVTDYEAQAAQLGATPLDAAGRDQTHRAYQAHGDALRAEIAGQATPEPDQLHARLDAADLIADRPFIEAVAGIPVLVDRMAVERLTTARAPQRAGDAEQVIAEMRQEDPQGALRTDVLLAVSATGRNLAETRASAERGQLEVATLAPTLGLASEFYARHAQVIDARIDREIAAGGFGDLPTYVASWPQPPASRNLHDIEDAMVAHTITQVLHEVDDDHAALRNAERMWERTADRAAIHEWSNALERGDIELAVERAGAPEQQLELGLHVDDDVDAGYEAEQEVG